MVPKDGLENVNLNFQVCFPSVEDIKDNVLLRTFLFSMNSRSIGRSENLAIATVTSATAASHIT
jgi:hypothetical protein